MKYSISSVVINKEKKQYKSYGSSSYDSDVELTVSQLKQEAKNSILFSETFDIKEEKLLIGNKLLEDGNEIINPRNLLNYQIILN